MLEPEQPGPGPTDPASSYLFDVFTDSTKTPAYRGRRISGQAIVRLPYALYGPTIVTHFPLFQSEEDRRLFSYENEADSFEKCRQRFEKLVLDKKATHFSKAALHRYVQENAPSPADIEPLEAALIPVWDRTLDALRQTFDSNPEYFVFDARTLISLDINRAAHDIVVNAIDPEALRPDVALAAAWEPFKKSAFSIVNGMLQVLLRQLNTALDKFKRDAQRDQHNPSEPLDRLGGVIAWFNARDIFYEDDAFTAPDGRGFKRTHSVGRKLYALDKPLFPLDHEPLVDKYVVWRRGEKNWRYTFCEGNFRYHAALEGIRFEHAARESERGGKDLARFIERLLSSRELNQSFPKLDLSDKQEELRSDYPFPGRRVSGAQYFVIPCELLIILACLTREIATLLAREKFIHDGGLKSATSKDFDRCIGNLCKIEEALHDKDRKKQREISEELKEAGPFRPRFDSAVATIKAAIKTRKSEAVMAAILEGAGELRGHLRSLHDEIVGVRLQTENAMTKDQDDFYHVFVELSELLWKRIYGGKVVRAGHDDFVASIVIDGRAIYFSNFRPHAEIGFTRTFFIDFRLAPYQRGRLVRRLCEIATYRMSCVKDRHLFYALQDGINQLNKSFTDVVSAASGGNWRKVAQELALPLYLKATRFDMYVPEGISACSRAVEGDWQRVKQQVSDIRERRLTGYAQLSDFLERGLAVSVMEITRVADRYEHLMERINELMSTIRTEISVSESQRQTRLIVATLVVGFAALTAAIDPILNASLTLKLDESTRLFWRMLVLALVPSLGCLLAWLALRKK